MKFNKHTALMMAGCGLMLVGIVILPFLGMKLGGILPYLFVLACPLSMVFMMGGMGKAHNHSGHGSEGDEEVHGSCHGETAPRTAPEPRALPAPPKGE